MSANEVDAIFDAVAAMSRRVIFADKVNALKAQIRSVTAKRCGNCYHWMKSTCAPEKEHGQFKNMNSFGCRDFAQEQVYADLAKEREAELQELIANEQEADTDAE